MKTPDVPQNDMEQLADEIATLSAHIDAATGRLLQMIARFDQEEGWGGGGFQSCAHWLSYRTSCDLGTARERVRVARALQDLPLISEAFCGGQLSYSKVRALTRVATPQSEQDLLMLAKDGTASHIERIVRLYRRSVGSEELLDCERMRLKQYWQTYTDDDGMLVVRGRLPPEIGAALGRALDQAMDSLQETTKQQQQPEQETGEDGQGKTRTFDAQGLTNLRVEAINLVARRALGDPTAADASDPPTARPAVPLVVVHVDAEVLADPAAPGGCHLEDGPSVPAETSRRLACDAQVVTVTHDAQGHLLDVGRTTRRISTRLARALSTRDPVCRFPGCDRTRHLQAHHIHHWASGGTTNLDNVLYMCTFHHAQVHEGQVQVSGSAQTPGFVDAQGRPIPDCCPVPQVADDPVAVLVQAHEKEGTHIDELSSLPTYDGMPVDYDWAVEALQSSLAPTNRHEGLSLAQKEDQAGLDT